MSVRVPNDVPRQRFMRYVRPPVPTTSGRSGESLYPIRPNTRKLRVGVDVDTLGESLTDLMSILARENEVEPVLLVQNDGGEPTQWLSTLGCKRWYTFSFVSVDEAPRFADASSVGIAGYEDGQIRHATSGHFFSVYAQLDQSSRHAGGTDSGITLADRHRAAALASAAAALSVDVIVTLAPTAGRDDVADNDLVLSVTPQQLLPLFGHYLRVTGNRVLQFRSESVQQGGGTLTWSDNARSVTDMYRDGIGVSVPHLTAIRAMSLMAGDTGLFRSADAIVLRLSRAARAVDTLLAALSNASDSVTGRTDIAEATADAFDRVLLCLCAALDRYARVTKTLLNITLDADAQRGSLSSIKELRSLLDAFEPTDTDELIALASYAWLMGKLRNRIHALPLDSAHRLSRAYGSSTTVAVTVEGVSELDPNTTLLTQEQFDTLGLWKAQAAHHLGARAYVADLATLATTLFAETLRYVETFSEFIVRNKPLDACASTHPVLGCWADDPRAMPAGDENEQLYRQMFGWADFGRPQGAGRNLAS